MAGTDGSYVWNMKALASVPTSKVNDDGSLTYTIKVKNDLKFSDGSAITAKNYIAYLLANSTAVSVAAGGNGTVGNTVVGYTTFNIYDGTNDGKDVVIKEAKDGKEAVTAKASKYFSGVQLIDDYAFAVAFTSDYAGYYYAMINASFSPSALALYLGSAGDIVVDSTTKQCGLNDAFYAKTTVEGKETYKTAAEIVANLQWNSKIPYSGPYYVANYDASSNTATLKLNKQYPGDDVGGTASIETITYVKIVSKTQLDMLKKGEVDVLAGITGGDDTKAALEAVKSSNGKFAETHYDRAGYGKLGFRCDFGPTAFASVRRAIIYTVNRPAFAQTFTGGYGSVVDGPYYEGFSAFKAVKDSIVLNKYTYSADSAVDELVEGGWVYNVRGEAFDASRMISATRSLKVMSSPRITSTSSPKTASTRPLRSTVLTTCLSPSTGTALSPTLLPTSLSPHGRPTPTPPPRSVCTSPTPPPSLLPVCMVNLAAWRTTVMTALPS
ncbi:MAG: ABC transporter substrate-binding protein [Eubacteriales bacterium]